MIRRLLALVAIACTVTEGALAIVTTPCARVPEQLNSFVVMRHITKVYSDPALLEHIRLDSCVSVRTRTKYENRTPGVTLDAAFSHLACHVEIALDAGFANKLQEFDTLFANVTHTEPGYDFVTDFAGLSGITFDVFKSTLAQRQIDVEPADEDFWRAPFDVWIRVTVLPGQIVTHGAASAIIDEYGTAVATSFHFGETLAP